MEKKNGKLLAGLMCSLILGSFAAPVFAEEAGAPIKEYSLEGVVV